MLHRISRELVHHEPERNSRVRREVDIRSVDLEALARSELMRLKLLSDEIAQENLPPALARKEAVGRGHCLDAALEGRSKLLRGLRLRQGLPGNRVHDGEQLRTRWLSSSTIARCCASASRIRVISTKVTITPSTM